MDHLFQKLGLNEKETRAFLALLKLGAKPVSAIAKEARIPRSSMYFTLDKLKEMQLIEEFTRLGIVYVRPIAVERLRDLLLEREASAKETIRILDQRLPELKAMENKLIITPVVQFHEGKEAVQKMYKELMREMKKYEFCGMYNAELLIKVLPNIFAVENMEYFPKSREILAYNADGRATLRQYRDAGITTSLKFFPKDVSYNSDIIIINDNIYMMTIDGEAIAGIHIQSPMLADAHRAIFDRIWDGLPFPEKVRGID